MTTQEEQDAAWLARREAAQAAEDARERKRDLAIRRQRLAEKVFLTIIGRPTIMSVKDQVETAFNAADEFLAYADEQMKGIEP